MINEPNNHYCYSSIVNCAPESGSLYDGKICLPEILDRLRICFEEDAERDVFWKYTLLAGRTSSDPEILSEARANAEYLIHLETLLYRINAGEYDDEGCASKLDKLALAAGLLQDSFHDPIRTPRHLFFKMLTGHAALAPTARGFDLRRVGDIRKSPLHLQISDRVPDDLLAWLLWDIYSAVSDQEGSKICFIIPNGDAFDELFATIRSAGVVSGVEAVRTARIARAPQTERTTQELRLVA